MEAVAQLPQQQARRRPSRRRVQRLKLFVRPSRPQQTRLRPRGQTPAPQKPPQSRHHFPCSSSVSLVGVALDPFSLVRPASVMSRASRLATAVPITSQSASTRLPQRRAPARALQAPRRRHLRRIHLAQSPLAPSPAPQGHPLQPHQAPPPDCHRAPAFVDHPSDVDVAPRLASATTAVATSEIVAGIL